jgi:carbonic anhydrase
MGWTGTCVQGHHQSPINLDFPPHAGQVSTNNTATATGPLVLRYPRFIKAGVTVENSGHGSPQINFPKQFSIEVNNQQYRLLQVHFHTPSEHTFNGKHFPAEAHLVHQNPETGERIVVAVMIRTGLGNGVIQAALDSAPNAETGTSANLTKAISLPTLLPGAVTGRRYATYNGSLTTPPCSEPIQWYVLLDPVQASPAQILELMSFNSGGTGYQLNARPVQPLNDRLVQYFL